jgi:hypothetical protein
MTKEESTISWENQMDNHITVAGELVDILYRHMYISEDSGHYLFDVLSDALLAHPGLIKSLSKELKEVPHE